jgi:hypothetical protein
MVPPRCSAPVSLLHRRFHTVSGTAQPPHPLSAQGNAGQLATRCNDTPHGVLKLRTEEWGIVLIQHRQTPRQQVQRFGVRSVRFNELTRARFQLAEAPAPRVISQCGNTP